MPQLYVKNFIIFDARLFINLTPFIPLSLKGEGEEI